jgi:glyoxylase-like metal-dependent hydrolase (beta-lactamase superfamily II)
MRIGTAPLHRVEELRIPNTIAHFTRDQALIEANRSWLQPHFLDCQDRFDLVFQSWILEVGGRVVLIDPCTGNGKPHPIPYFDRLDVPYIERMEATGYRTQDIDFVVCTHLHHDHCGWNTHLRDGRWVPTFAHARYLIGAAEYARWGANAVRHRTPAYNVGVFERSVLPVMEAGLADLVGGYHTVIAGLTLEPAPGHTLGHQMLHLQSSGQHALFTGDCFHHPIQLVDPTNAFGDAEDPQVAAATRRQLVRMALDLGAVLIPAHLPAPYAVSVTRIEGETRFAAAGAVPPQAAGRKPSAGIDYE